MDVTGEGKQGTGSTRKQRELASAQAIPANAAAPGKSFNGDGHATAQAVTFGEPGTLARQIMSMVDRECIICLPSIDRGLAELWQLAKDSAARGVSIVALISTGAKSELRDHHLDDLPQQGITLVLSLIHI